MVSKIIIQTILVRIIIMFKYKTIIKNKNINSMCLDRLMWYDEHVILGNRKTVLVLTKNKHVVE